MVSDMASRSKARRQWVSQYDFSDYTFPSANANTKIRDPTANGFHGHNYDHDHDICKSKFASCFEQYKHNRKRTLLWTVVITIVALNGLQFQFAGLPARLQSYNTNSYTGNNNNELKVGQQISLQDRNLGGCDETTAEQHRSLRNRNLGGCLKTAYITPDQADTFLYSSDKKDDYSASQPTHITLCKELIRRNDEAKNQDSKPQRNPFFGDKIKSNGHFEVHESQDVCTDWERPHSALMQIISSQIIAQVGSRFGLQYTSNCQSTILSNIYLDFDVTTAQQIFPQNPMPFDEKKLSLGEVVFDLCRECITEESNIQQPMHKSNIENTHHCFLFPKRGEAHTGYMQEEDEDSGEVILDEENKIIHTALDAALPIIRNRLNHESVDWSPRARIPNHDPKEGAVIYLDATHSLPIDYHHYLDAIDKAKHVSIISSPRCVKSKLGNGDLTCLEYGNTLMKVIQSKHETSFDLISSTATAYSRMILSNILVCPPGSVTCLFPALARGSTKRTVIFESSDDPSTFHWFQYLTFSMSKEIEIRPLTYDEMRIVTVQQNIDKKFKSVSVNKVMNSEGDTPSSYMKPLPDTINSNQHKVDMKFSEPENFDSSGGTVSIQDILKPIDPAHDNLVIELENSNSRYEPLVIKDPKKTNDPDAEIDIEDGSSSETIPETRVVNIEKSPDESTIVSKSSNTMGDTIGEGEFIFDPKPKSKKGKGEIIFDNNAKKGKGEIIFDKAGN